VMIESTALTAVYAKGRCF